MASTRQTRSMTSSSAPSSKPALEDFRIGEDQASDASDSEADQSAHIERSQSPEKVEGKSTKSRKKRERKKVNALTDGLDVLLVSAFKGEGVKDGGVIGKGGEGGKGNETEDMEVELTGVGVGKKMTKRTRQNLFKMEQRRQQKLANKQRQTVPEPTPQLSIPMARKPLGAKKKAKDERRARKKRARMARKEAEGERMDIA